MRHKLSLLALLFSEVGQAQAQGGGQLGAQFLVLGQQMGLFVFAVLQAVFDTSQESIGGQQLVADLLVQQTGRALTAQGLVQVGGLQGRLPSTAYQLIELDHKLKFSNPASPQLDVVPGLHAIAVQGAACPVLTDALAQAAQGRQGIKVKILAVHKRGTQRFEVMYIAGATAAFKGLGLDGARLRSEEHTSELQSRENL